MGTRELAPSQIRHRLPTRDHRALLTEVNELHLGFAALLVRHLDASELEPTDRCGFQKEERPRDAAGREHEPIHGFKSLNRAILASHLNGRVRPPNATTRHGERVMVGRDGRDHRIEHADDGTNAWACY